MKSVLVNINRHKYQSPQCKQPYKIGSLVYIRTHYLRNMLKKCNAKLAPKLVENLIG